MTRRSLIRAVYVFGALISPGAPSLPHAAAQFTSLNVTQHDWLDLATLGGAQGCDCWGYVAPSGREYALMGLNNKISVVEITNPASPVIVGSAPHNNSTWCDVKTYGQYAYAVVEFDGGGGMTVIDLTNVDGGTVSVAGTVTAGGLNSSHNVAINTDSGYLYLLGSNLNGGAPVVYDLNASATAPPEVGRWTEPSAAALHDAHIVSYTSGPYAGREILFGFGEERGVDILDVTNKSNIFLLSRTTYPGIQYCHQGWTSPDLKYLYVNDEMDEGATVFQTRTLIFDITDLTSPVLAGTFSTGLPSRDHNLYIRDCVMYETNYSTGLRVINLSQPLAPIEVGFYDTYPENDSVNFNGAWSNYPFFPSGTVIVSDIERGLFILDVSQALAASAAIPGGLAFEYPSGRPATVVPDGGTTMQVQVSGVCDAVPQSMTGTLHYDDGMGFASAAMLDLGGGLYEATFPATTCGQTVSYYVSAQTTGGSTFTDPPDAPSTVYTTLSASGFATVFADDFQADQGWTAANLGASTGDWERGVPVNDGGWDFDPLSDSDGSGSCFLTENQFGNTDVDNGSVRLTSPAINMTAGDMVVSYDYYLYLTDDSGGIDRLLAEISSNDLGGPWIEIARHDTNGGTSWRAHTITQSDLDAAGVTLTANMRLRFTANDDNPQSIVEAGLDAFLVQSITCTSCSDGIQNQGEDRIDCGGPCTACACLSDAACDDGAFCNGVETCDGFGMCRSAADPCGAGEACRESDDVCVPHGNGDFDTDTDVDLFDFARFQVCFGQEAGAPCEPGNLTGDIIIDAGDYGAFEQLLTGP